MAEILNPLSNLSYTNKDFQTIYPELLSLVKKLSYKWDPTISDESDPGVVLIKLNALIADKCNYNIDKNVLETFPQSVTQEKNARQLYDQLGYKMHWYKGATTSITFTWIGSLEDTSYTSDTVVTIPAFTEVTDAKNSIVYTTIEDAILTMDKTQPVTVSAIQGIGVRYTVDGTELIKIQHLDSNNRLYFDDYNVAENGIFIWNDNDYVQAYEDWHKVDNIAIQPLSTKCFEFGISSDGNSCYIEFPEDIDTLIGEGIHIEYVKTDGNNGTVSATVLEKFLEDVAVTDPVDSTQTLSLTTENVRIRNNSASFGGMNPETISDAYKGYQKQIGTFNTLVTLRDYINAINMSDIICNNFVCDRTNDPQSCYYIITNEGSVDTPKLQIIETDDQKELNAFDLKLYLLQYSDYDTSLIIPDTAQMYNSSFDLVMPNSSKMTLLHNDTYQGYLDTYKSVQHDFQPFVASDVISDPMDIRPCLFKNKFNLNARIIPYYQLTTTQITNILENIQLALYSALYSKNLTFGQEIDYDSVFDIISSADERIKSIALDDITYETYATYVTKEYDAETDKFIYTANETKVSLEDLTPAVSGAQVFPFLSQEELTAAYADNDIKQFIRKDIFSKSVLAGKTQLLAKGENFQFGVNQQLEGLQEEVTKISSELSINFSNVDNQYQLLDNENIQIFKPSLTTDASYGYAVKYAYNLLRDVSAKSDYTLAENEWIVFYWKQESTDTVYKFRLYNAGTVISPSFALSTRQEALDVSIRNTLSGPFGLVSGNVNENTAVGNTGYTLKTVVDSNHVFSATQEVSIKKQNQSVLTTPFNFYWVLNNIEDDQYVLFDAGESSYILGPNEYVFYTTDEKEDLVILGPGTQIERAVDTDVWSVPVKDLKTLLDFGIDAFSDEDWKRIDCSLNNVTITEMQITNLGKGCTILFSNLTQTLNVSATLQELPQDVTISYISTDGQQVDMPEFSGGGFDNYLVRTVYNIVIVNSQPFCIYSSDVASGKVTRTLTITYGEPETQYSIVSDSSDNIYVQSNYTMSYVGAQNISTKILTVDGSYVYPEIYWYKPGELEQDSQPSSFDMTTNEVILQGSSSNTSYELTFQLPEGNYIMPVRAACVAGIEITDSSSNPLSIFNTSEDTSNLNHVKLYFVNLVISDATTPYILNVTLTGSNVTTSVGFLPLFQYVDTYDTSLVSAVLERISELDTGNLFDYTYDVDDTLNIINPLSASSFLNNQHIYNKYTICQLNTTSLKNIKVINKVKAQG